MLVDTASRSTTRRREPSPSGQRTAASPTRTATFSLYGQDYHGRCGNRRRSPSHGAAAPLGLRNLTPSTTNRTRVRLPEHDPAPLPRRGSTAGRPGRDTDFKTPNQWNGWQIDPSKFPDRRRSSGGYARRGYTAVSTSTRAFSPSDPQFERAQQIAKGKLSRGACSGGGADCYVFDFGDPDQLAAYLGLQLDDGAARCGLLGWTGAATRRSPLWLG